MSGYDWGKMSVFAVAGMGGCWTIVVSSPMVVVWLEVLDIGGVGIVVNVDVLLKGMRFVMYTSNPKS